MLLRTSDCGNEECRIRDICIVSMSTFILFREGLDWTSSIGLAECIIETNIVLPLTIYRPRATNSHTCCLQAQALECQKGSLFHSGRQELDGFDSQARVEAIGRERSCGELRAHLVACERSTLQGRESKLFGDTTRSVAASLPFNRLRSFWESLHADGARAPFNTTAVVCDTEKD